MPERELVERRILDGRLTPDLDFLLEELNPARWGWDSLAEWLLDQTGLVDGRPQHLGRVHFQRHGLRGGTVLIEEGIRPAPDAQERHREARYREKVRAIVLLWRAAQKV